MEMSIHMSEIQHPISSDRAWAIEQHGIELFWIWFAANIGILGIIYEGILAAASLNIWQSLLVSLVAPVVPFVLVGILSMAGEWGGAPMKPVSICLSS